MNYRLRWIHLNFTPCPTPSQSCSSITVSLSTQVEQDTQSFFSVYTQTLKFDWKSLFPSVFWAQDSVQPARRGRACLQSAVNGLLVQPECCERQHCTCMYWIVTKIALRKDAGKKPALFRTDVFFLFSFHHCFYDLVRRYHCRVGRALDRNSGDLGWSVDCHYFLCDLGQVLGLSFPICKMRSRFSTRAIIPLSVCVCVYEVSLCQKRWMCILLEIQYFFNLKCFKNIIPSRAEN